MKWLLLLLLSGCALTDCRLYGVALGDDPREVRIATAAKQGLINAQCGLNSDAMYETAGCMTYNDDGTVDLFWLEGDLCVREHEYCHAQHGPEHTREYLSRIQRDLPSPACIFPL